MKIGSEIKKIYKGNKIRRISISKATGFDDRTIKSIEETDDGKLSTIRKILEFLGYELVITIVKIK